MGTLPPLAAIRASTVLCSQTFIFAESPNNSAGQPNSVASSLRAAKLLSMSSSFNRSTIEVRQLSFCGFAAARFSSCATTSTTATGFGGGGAAGALGGVPGAVLRGGAALGASVDLPIPSFARILSNNPIAFLLVITCYASARLHRRSNRRPKFDAALTLMTSTACAAQLSEFPTHAMPRAARSQGFEE